MAITLSRKYPHLIDHLLNPTFYEAPRQAYGPNPRINRWCHFWNMTGARSTNTAPKYQCVVCGDPIKKLNSKKYRACKHCSARYARAVKTGKVKNPATFEVYAL